MKSLKHTGVWLSIIFLCLSLAAGLFPVQAAETNSSQERSLPLRAIIIVDESQKYNGRNSELFRSVERVLQINKIAFDVVDVRDVSQDTLNNRGYLRYAVMLLMAPGWRIDRDKSELITGCVQRGSGLVGLLPEAANEYLSSPFGIDKAGEKWQENAGLLFIKDKFTFSYRNETLLIPSLGLDHKPLSAVDVVAKFTDSDAPAIWTYQQGAGKTVFHNNNITAMVQYQGILLQSILYAIPVGVASPVNIGVLEVDDSPRSFSSEQQLQAWHYNYTTNLMRLLETYNMKATFFISFSYSGDINDFWKYSESLEFANTVIKSGNELGIHCGSKHVPLDRSYWGDGAVIEAEVGKIADMIKLLEQKLFTTYGTRIKPIVSYIAPANNIEHYAYKVLADKLGIRYVGTGYDLSPTWEEHGSVTSAVYYSPVFRDFEWEEGVNIYNIPRVRGGFCKLTKEQETLKSDILRALMESGSPYVAFTHPEELEILPEGTTKYAMCDLFESYKEWADYVTAKFPHYRWLTSAELGSVMEKRTGVLTGEWFPDSMTLKLQLPQAEDIIHIKTDYYLRKVEKSSTGFTLTFSKTAGDTKAAGFQVIKLNKDYFIYGDSAAKAVSAPPVKPFTYVEAPMPSRAPVAAVITSDVTTTEEQTTIVIAEIGADNTEPLKALPVVSVAVAGLVFTAGLGYLLKKSRPVCSE